MQFTETPLSGAFIVDLDRKHDDRGFFARAFCQREFDEHGLSATVRQANISYNHAAGTLRGLHFLYPPGGETKIVRCIAGELFDVIVDLRPESSTFLRHASVVLSAENGRCLVVPERFAHGFLTLANDTEVLYFMSDFYTPAEECGLRWNDSSLGIEWPRPVEVIVDRDARWPLVSDQLDSLRQRMVAPPHSVSGSVCS